MSRFGADTVAVIAAEMLAENIRRHTEGAEIGSMPIL